MPRKNLFSITIDKDDKLELVTQTKRYGLSQKEIVGYLIQLNGKYNLMSGDWKARLEGVDQERNRYAGLQGSCPALTFADKSYVCLWGQDGKPPAKKNLSRDLDEALEMCAACKKTLNIKLENESYQVKVQELETKLKVQSAEKFKVPVCNYGGILAADGISFSACRLNPGKLASIENYCKVRMNGKPCTSYIERLIGVGKKLD